MPKYNPSYDDEPLSDEESNGGKQESSTSTALIPKSVLGGKSCEVGDEITCTITAIHDDEIQVEVSGYSENEPEETEDETEDVEAPMPDESGSEDVQEPAVPQPAYE